MIPYTVIKEANRPEHSGTATGVINFINFSFSALLGPVFGGLLMRASGGGERELGHYQAAFEPLLYGVGLAILLTLCCGKRAGRRAATAADGRRSQREPAGERPTGGRRCQTTALEAAHGRDDGDRLVRLRAGPLDQGDQRPRLHPAERHALLRRRGLPRRTDRAHAGDLGQARRPCSSRSARRACSTSRRSRARSPRTTPAISTRTTRSSSACRPRRR